MGAPPTFREQQNAILAYKALGGFENAFPVFQVA
jgi:hypothetical protein